MAKTKAYYMRDTRSSPPYDPSRYLPTGIAFGWSGWGDAWTYAPLYSQAFSFSFSFFFLYFLFFFFLFFFFLFFFFFVFVLSFCFLYFLLPYQSPCL
jgi:hypothetical protein